MQRLVTPARMQELDRAAMTRFSIPGMLLMENAGKACADLLERRFAPFSGKSIVIVCGKGNNGGDGFVVARHLADKGARIHVALLAAKKDVKGDAARNLAILSKLVKHTTDLSIREYKAAGKLSGIPDADLVVDALFGTGFQGKVKGLHLAAIQWMNNQKARRISIDIPSGVDASTGAVGNVAVHADLTITMALAKVGHYIGKGREHSGEVKVVDIGIPAILTSKTPGAVFRPSSADIADVLPRRSLTSHKYSVGKVLVIGGSRQFVGAPVMTALAAMRCGAGAVVVCVPRSIETVMKRKMTEILVDPVEETADGTIAASAFDAIMERVEWADVVAIGPGLSLQEETRSLVLGLLERAQKPFVVDADALASLAGRLPVVRNRKSATILTPHTGELSRLIGVPSEEIEMFRVDHANASARKLKCIVVLKGSPTVSATPEGRAYLNTTGNPGMATIGSGDVLTGIISSCLAQGMSPVEATYAGVYLHGSAGDRAAVEIGERSIMAMDLVDYLPDAIRGVATA